MIDEVQLLRELARRVDQPWPAERQYGQAAARLARERAGHRGAPPGTVVVPDAIADQRFPHWNRDWLRAARAAAPDWRTAAAIRAGLRIDGDRVYMDGWLSSVPPGHNCEAAEASNVVWLSRSKWPATEQGLQELAAAVSERLHRPHRTRRPIANSTGEVTGWDFVPVPADASARAQRQIERIDRSRSAKDSGMLVYHPFSWMPSVVGVRPIVLRWPAETAMPKVERWQTSEAIRAGLRFDRERHSGVDPGGWFAAVPAEHIQAASNAFYPAVSAPPSWSTLDELASAVAARLAPVPVQLPAVECRLARHTIGALAAHYCPRRADGSYSRAAARAWLRAFRQVALIASDALETIGTAAAVAVLRTMLDGEDAARLTSRPDPAVAVVTSDRDSTAHAGQRLTPSMSR